MRELGTDELLVQVLQSLEGTSQAEPHADQLALKSSSIPFPLLVSSVWVRKQMYMSSILEPMKFRESVQSLLADEQFKIGPAIALETVSPTYRYRSCVSPGSAKSCGRVASLESFESTFGKWCNFDQISQLRRLDSRENTLPKEAALGTKVRVSWVLWNCLSVPVSLFKMRIRFRLATDPSIILDTSLSGTQILPAKMCGLFQADLSGLTQGLWRADSLRFERDCATCRPDHLSDGNDPARTEVVVTLIGAQRAYPPLMSLWDSFKAGWIPSENPISFQVPSASLTVSLKSERGEFPFSLYEGEMVDMTLELAQESPAEVVMIQAVKGVKLKGLGAPNYSNRIIWRRGERNSTFTIFWYDICV